MKRFPTLGILLVSLIAVFSSCISGDIAEPFSSSQASHLLTSSSSKSWLLQARSEGDTDVFNECINGNILTFVASTEGDSLYVLGKPVVCEDITVQDTLFKADFKLIETPSEKFTNVIELTNVQHEDISEFFVEQVTSGILVISYTLEDQNVKERYSF